MSMRGPLVWWEPAWSTTEYESSFLNSEPDCSTGFDLEDLEAVNESLLDMVDVSESREGGTGSEKVAVTGDCNLDDGTEMTTGEDTAVLPGLLEGAAVCPACDCLVAFGERIGGSSAGSFAPLTDALMRLYKPLRPPCTSSMPLESPAPTGAGGAVKSSKVVSVSERDAVACIWWSASSSDPRESRAMVAYARVSSAVGAQYVWERKGYDGGGGKLRLEKSNVVISQYDHAR